MNHSRLRSVGWLALALSVAPGFAAPRTDLTSPAKRQQSVDLATKLSAPPVVAPLPDTLPAPFNPPDFDRLDPEEQRPVAPPPSARPAAGPTPASQANVDRDVLASLAPRIQPTGTLTGRDGRAMLTFPDARRLSVGQGFIVSDNDQNYELEIVAIDRTTFTLRYRQEEIVRPIRAAK